MDRVGLVRAIQDLEDMLRVHVSDQRQKKGKATATDEERLATKCDVVFRW